MKTYNRKKKEKVRNAFFFRINKNILLLFISFIKKSNGFNIKLFQYIYILYIYILFFYYSVSLIYMLRKESHQKYHI